MLNTGLQIGNVLVPNRVLLAPLAGVSDLPFRRICQEMGAGLTYIEMLSARTLIHGARSTRSLLARHASESLLGAQLTGPTPELVAAAIDVLEAHSLDTIDLNMGCPVKKIVAKQSGSAILKDPERVSRTVMLARERTSRPVTAKIRLGYDQETRNVAEISRRLASAGVAMVSIHGRLREDRYDVPVDYAGIAAGVAAVREEAGDDLPVVGNGDIMDAETAWAMLERTGCDAIMISRGVLGNPWIFRQILVPGTPQPTVAEWRDVLMRHLAYHRDHYGDGKFDIIPFRKHLLWYTSGFPGMRRLREELNTVDHPDRIVELVDTCLDRLDPATRRYEANREPMAEDAMSARYRSAGTPAGKSAQVVS